jgi:hypothetical protein
VALDGLASGTTYYYRVSSTDTTGKERFWPNRDGTPASFTTSAADTKAPEVSGVRTLSLPDGTAQVTWTTDEPSTSRVRFGTSRKRLPEDRVDDELARKHMLVVTGLDADRVYWLRVASADASGNVADAGPLRLRTVGTGTAVQTAEEFRTGRATGRLRVSSAGLGQLTLRGPGTGSYLSRVIDTGLKVDWRRAVVDADRPAGTTVRVLVRTGPTRKPGGSWSSWREAGGRIATSGRYLQYRVILTASGAAVPSVSAVGFTHNGRPPKESPETRH